MIDKNKDDLTPNKKPMPTKKTKIWTPLKLFFLLMTLAGMVGTLVSLGILIFSVSKQLIITDQEYILSERFYELESCRQPIYKPTAFNEENYTSPTDTEIVECERKKTEQLIASRKANFKVDTLRGSIWTLLFLIILFVHYPRFMRYHKE